NFMNYVAHAAARQAGSGLGHIYHIFLPQGVDACFNATFCYSPDNLATWVLCAAHTATLFVDAVGLTVFTVEPYQNVPGCSVAPGATPNGQLADSTYYALLHEVFETISDPWPYSAWYVHALTFGYGNEIADVCESLEVVNGNIYSGVSNIKLNGHS